MERDALLAALDQAAFVAWLEGLGEGACGRYGDPMTNVLCRFLRETGRVMGATLYPGDSARDHIIACYVPGPEMGEAPGHVLLYRVGKLPLWVGDVLLAEEELHDEAVEEGALEPEVHIPARALLRRLQEMWRRGPAGR